MEFDFFTEVCEMLGILNGACKDVASVCTLLHKLLECVHRYDIYQVCYGEISVDSSIDSEFKSFGSRTTKHQPRHKSDPLRDLLFNAL